MLVDTSVWVSHFRFGNPTLGRVLNEGSVDCHPFIIGELACGNLKNRYEILSLLRALPQLPTVESEEVLRFIEQRRLAGLGVGLIDMHLLASVVLFRTTLWTEDKNLQKVATRLGVASIH
jgi:predicted nucleic acid-binding protein